MRVLFLSANKLGLEVLKELRKALRISAIVTLSPNSKTVMYDGVDVSEWHGLGAQVYLIKEISDEVQLFKKLNPELVLMCGWRQIVPEEILRIPTKGFYGFHPTLLPEGRGPAPLINSIMLNLKESGVTMFKVSNGIDDGDIVGQEKFIIEKDDYVGDVYKKATEATIKLIKYYLYRIKDNKIQTKKQGESKSKRFPKRKLLDNKINIDEDPMDVIYRKIRALSHPYKGAYIEKDGKRLVIWDAELQEIEE